MLKIARYRKTQINDRSREVARLHKILEDTGIKLGCVASDIMGKSGREMLNALVAGTTNPVVLADLAQGLLRKKSRAEACERGSGYARWIGGAAAVAHEHDRPLPHVRRASHRRARLPDHDQQARKERCREPPADRSPSPVG